MKFLGNMGISGKTIDWLRQQKHDALHLRDEGLQRMSDADILIKARNEQRTVLTMDLDFGYLMAISKAELPSVIIFRLSDERAEVVNERLAEILAHHTDDLQSGCVISVSDEEIRVRKLPIE